MRERRLDVLVIDDDELTAEIVHRSFSKHGPRCRVVAAVDGQDGLDVLRNKSDRFVNKPFLILLDLYMPRMNGFEFLEALRGDPALLDSVVFVLTSSNADADRSRVHHDHIAGYMTKTALGLQFARLSTLLAQYAETAALP